MHIKIYLLALLCYVCCTNANLEGPFLFFGPKSLEKYRRPALKYLEQDDLMKIYEEQAAIVVFNNQDSVPLSSGCFPRLRKMLEGQTMLVLPQDFLDVHPDYISNETQMLTLQGPWSERDAQMTETFARLHDIYGEGRVLGILGNSVSQPAAVEEAAGEWARARRQASAPGDEDDVADDRAAGGRALPKYALYNASSPPGKGALLYSSGWPEVRWPDGAVAVLSTPVGEPTVKTTRLYTFLVVRFADGNSTYKTTLDFSFKQSQGWWIASGVEVKRGLEMEGLNLQAPAPPDTPSAVLGKAYHCSLPLVYTSKDGGSLTLPDIRMQMFMDSTEKFSDAFDCIGFTTVPIWSGLMIAFLMLMVLGVSVTMIMGIKTMDRFENTRGKQLTITVSE
ncbi:uncharacterized protein LOC113225544 [Hyposmocoma kahamanoa]|uniref:uncharacterized protein LOC113225544 n=1 Tax=Hyposmocoma kahamanoa TaxID=1477025 RepID=UPI000E6D9619|nr:uncharacterized protein LOC113225544 [Hyposmocoma kahamanoa]